MSDEQPQSQATTGDRRDTLEPAPVPAPEEPSSYADDPMTLLWQNADDRETGAEAVQAMRARHRGPDGSEPA